MRKFRAWQEIGDLPDYRGGVDAGTAQIDEFICHYELEPPFRPCGIAGCTHPHADGHLVRLHDGSVTNVGRCCADRIPHFDEKLLRWHKRVGRSEKLRRVAGDKARIAENAAIVADLIAINSTLRSRLRSFGMHFPAGYAALKHRFCKGDLLVHKSTDRPVHDSEAAAREAYRKRHEPAPATTIVGQLGGMSIFGPPVGTRLSELSAFVDELASISSLCGLSDHRLAEIELCIDFFDSQLAAMRAQIADSDKFFSAHNYWLILQDETLPGKERRALEACGCDAFISGKFGSGSRATHRDPDAQRARAARRTSGDAHRADVESKSRGEFAAKRNSNKP